MEALFNIKGAFLHLVADAAVSVGDVLAGIAIVSTVLQVVDHLRFTLERQAIAGCCIWYVNSDDVQLLKDGGVI